MGCKSNFSESLYKLEPPVELVYYDQLANQIEPIFLTVNKLDSHKSLPDSKHLFSKDILLIDYIIVIKLKFNTLLFAQLSIFISSTGRRIRNQAESLISPIEHCIRTKWTESVIDWNGSEPLL